MIDAPGIKSSWLVVEEPYLVIEDEHADVVIEGYTSDCRR
jgi:hypothetical protein